MSSEITVAFVQQFGSNVFHLSQQKGSRLRGAVRNESQNGDSQYFDRIGKVTAQLKTGRHSNTPQIDTPHSRRRVTMDDYEWADLIDKQDKIRMLNDPASEYVMAAMWAMGRAMDDLILAAAIGSAYGGVAGATAVVLPAAQKYAANNATVVTNLNVRTLRAIKKKFWQAEVDTSEGLYFAVQGSQLEALLGQTEVTSSDYNSVKALVQGEINSFMGFNFIHTERIGAQVDAISGLGTTGATGSGTSLIGARQCIAWCKSGLLLATGMDITARISERDDKSYSTQAYASMSLGATRMEEEKVVEVFCTE